MNRLREVESEITIESLIMPEKNLDKQGVLCIIKRLEISA